MKKIREETIGNSTLYLGNCIEILPKLGLVHHIITDPPYEAEAHTKQRRSLGCGKQYGARNKRNDALSFDPINQTDREKFCLLAKDICSGWMLAFCQAEAIGIWRESMGTHDIRWSRAQIWVKPDGAPQFTGDRPGVGYEAIATGWVGRGRSKWNGGGRHGVYFYGKHDIGMGHGSLKKNAHPTTKPQSLMLDLVRLFTNQNDIVLDPFMGSGSTGVACVRYNRSFIGIEIDPKWFDEACRRLEAAEKMRGDLFMPPAAKLIQEGFVL